MSANDPKRISSNTIHVEADSPNRRWSSVAPAHDLRPMLDGVPRLADHLGKCVLLVVEAPLSLVIHLDEMSQRLPGAEKLLFSSIALDCDCEGLGHRLKYAHKDLKIKSSL